MNPFGPSNVKILRSSSKKTFFFSFKANMRIFVSDYNTTTLFTQYKRKIFYRMLELAKLSTSKGKKN